MKNQPQPHAVLHSSFAGRIGLAKVDITPPIGIYSRSWGAATLTNRALVGAALEGAALAGA